MLRLEWLAMATIQGGPVYTKAWLQSGGMKLGTIVTIDHPAIVEIARLAGLTGFGSMANMGASTK